MSKSFCEEFVNNFVEIYRMDKNNIDKCRLLKRYLDVSGEFFDRYQKIFEYEIPLGIVAICGGHRRIVQYPKIDYNRHVEFSNLFRALYITYSSERIKKNNLIITNMCNYRTVDMKKFEPSFSQDAEKISRQLNYSDVSYPVTQIVIGELKSGFNNDDVQRDNGYYGVACISVETRECIILREVENFVPPKYGEKKENLRNVL